MSLFGKLVILGCSYRGIFVWSVVSLWVSCLFMSWVWMRFVFGWKLRFLVCGLWRIWVFWLGCSFFFLIRRSWRKCVVRRVFVCIVSLLCRRFFWRSSKVGWSWKNLWISFILWIRGGGRIVRFSCFGLGFVEGKFIYNAWSIIFICVCILY